MAAISIVFAIARVAEMLGEDEEWLREISINMDPEEGRLWVIRIGEDEQPALTEYGVECLRQIIIEERAFPCAKGQAGSVAPAALTGGLRCKAIRASLLLERFRLRWA